MVRILFLTASLLYLAADSNDNRIAANDNRLPAGRFENGVLTVHLEAREGMWHPDADDAPGLPVYAFAEVGKPAQIPGPLIRAPAGTEVRLRITNRIAGKTLRVHGLQSRPADSFERLLIEPGATQAVVLKLTAEGTYTYWGATTDSAIGRRVGMDTQLTGAIVVDPAGTSKARDRVFVITQYVDSLLATGAANENGLFLSAINGKSWPHTERLDYERGDTIRWRWVNGTFGQHPMHLHGFYFRIHARGNGVRDSAYAVGTEPLAVTDRMLPASTMSLSWSPERSGNWLFHCHVPRHVEPHKPIDGSKSPMKAMHHSKNHSMEGMGGLVLGIHVRGETEAAPTPQRHLRLLAVRDTAGDEQRPTYRFVLEKPDTRALSGIGQMMSPVLILKRNEPVAITVVNTLSEPTAVHWHGIELQSYFDGVAGFGGTPDRISPIIEPGDSFVAHMTPPRAGTFIYHTHVDEMRQEPAGLSGIIAVVENDFDARTDHPVLLTTVRAVPVNTFQINNAFQLTALEFRAGAPHRLRIVNMMLGPPRGMLLTLKQDSTVQSWRPLAKDGADLPALHATLRPARVQVATGETYDFEVLIENPGDYYLDVEVPGGPANAPRRALPIRVR